ncbi:hypothetical protein HDU93_003294 [Gonapodya sp. JEL0774]|nr:hypothetical protein HDU93_003294 [Gonapodya sp. JEL0774]
MTMESLLASLPSDFEPNMLDWMTIADGGELVMGTATSQSSYGNCRRPFVNLSSLKKHFNSAHPATALLPHSQTALPPQTALPHHSMSSTHEIPQTVLQTDYTPFNLPLPTNMQALVGDILATNFSVIPTEFFQDNASNLSIPFPTPSPSSGSPDPQIPAQSIKSDQPRKRHRGISPPPDVDRSISSASSAPHTPPLLWVGGLAHRELLESISRFCLSVSSSGRRWRRLWARLSAAAEELGSRVEKVGGIDRAPVGTKFLYADFGRLLHDIDNHLSLIPSSGPLANTLGTSDSFLQSFSRRLRTMHSDLRLGGENWWRVEDDREDELEDYRELRKHFEGLNPYDKYNKEVRERIQARVETLEASAYGDRMVVDAFS